MTWNQELKDSALPDLKAHVDAINGEGVSSKQLFFLCMGMGIQRDFMGEVPPRKSDSVRLEYLDEKDFALLKTVALAYKKTSVFYWMKMRLTTSPNNLHPVDFKYLQMK